MSERAEALLKMSGLHEILIASLEREGVVFGLTNQTLLYQDAGGTRRVTLRDLTRIHSDRDGTLRVETPAGTALTASLVGFDPVDVQTFFGQVRDTTARVKQFPATPSTPTAAIPTPGRPAAPVPTPAPVTAPVTPPPSAASSAASAPAAAPSGRAGEPGGGFQESVTIIRAGANASNQNAANQTQITPPPPKPSRTPTLIIPPPAPASEVRSPTLHGQTQHESGRPLDGRTGEFTATGVADPRANQVKVTPVRQPEEVRNPTLITTPQAAPMPAPTPATLTQPQVPPRNPTLISTPPTPAAPVTPPPPAATVRPVVREVVREKEQDVVKVPEPVEAAEVSPEPLPEVAPSVAARPAVTAAGSLAALAAHAESTRAWVGRLRFMAVLMLLAALALAYLQFNKGQGLTGVWVLIAGGMSAVALLALADLTKLLTSLSSAVSAEGGVMDVD